MWLYLRWSVLTISPLPSSREATKTHTPPLLSYPGAHSTPEVKIKGEVLGAKNTGVTMFRRFITIHWAAGSNKKAEAFLSKDFRQLCQHQAASKKLAQEITDVKNGSCLPEKGSKKLHFLSPLGKISDQL